MERLLLHRREDPTMSENVGCTRTELLKLCLEEAVQPKMIVLTKGGLQEFDETQFAFSVVANRISLLQHTFYRRRAFVMNIGGTACNGNCLKFIWESPPIGYHNSFQLHRECGGSGIVDKHTYTGNFQCGFQGKFSACNGSVQLL